MSIIEDVVRTQLEVVGLEAWTGGFLRASRVAGGLGTQFTDLQRQSLALGAAFGFGATLTFRLAGSMLKAGGELQLARVGMEGLLGSGQLANKMIHDLQDLALATPFDFPDMVTGARRLLAFQVPAEQILPLMRATADAVAAAGGTTENYASALEGLGKIQAHGKLLSRDLLVLAASGIPIYGILRKELGLTDKQLQNLGKAGITAPVALQAIQKGLNESFGGAAERQINTLVGSVSNFKDALWQVAGVASGGLLGPITWLMNIGSSFLRWLRDAPGIASVLGVALVGLGVTLAVLGVKFAWAAYQAIFAARSFYQAGTAAAVANAAMGGSGAASTAGAGLTGAAAAAAGFRARNPGLFPTAAPSLLARLWGGLKAGFTPTTSQYVVNAAEQASFQAYYGRMPGVNPAGMPAAIMGTRTNWAGPALRGLGIVGGAAGLYGSYQMAKQAQGPWEQAASVGAGAISGAALGASIGSFFPGPGNVIGGIGGAIVGAITTGFGLVRDKETEEAKNPLEAENARLKDQADVQQAQLDELRALRQAHYELVHGREGAGDALAGMRAMSWAMGGGV